MHVTPQGHLTQRAGLVKKAKGWFGQTEDFPSKLRMHAACMLHACCMHENVFACMQACMHSKLHAC